MLREQFCARSIELGKGNKQYSRHACTMLKWGKKSPSPQTCIPAATISDLDCAYLGSTRPGQSHRVRSLVMLRVWKCLVLPGVGATAVFLEPKRALMVEDLPTLGYPVRPTVTRPPSACIEHLSTSIPSVLLAMSKAGMRESSTHLLILACACTVLEPLRKS